MDEGKSHSSREEDEAPRVSKQLKIGHHGQEKEVDTQSVPQAWLSAPMFHGEPLMDNASLRDFRGGEGTYVADVLERSLLLPTDMAELGNLRRQEVFLSIKRYLGMVRLPTLVILVIFVPWFLTYSVLVSIGRLSRPLIGWKRTLRSSVGPWSLSVTSAWMLHGPLKTPRLISQRQGRS